MDCRDAETKLAAYLGGALTPPERAELERHLDGCPICGAGDLLDDVLARTSGPVCVAVHDRLADFVDGALDAVETDLVREHVEHCTECTALAGAMRGLVSDLPALVRVEVDAKFVPDVMAATAFAASRAGRSADRFGDFLRSLIARPRIAWEGAYVASAILAVVFGVPGSPLAQFPSRALELVRLNPVQELRAPVGAVWSSAGAPVVEASVSAARNVWRGAREDLGTLWPDAASTDGETNEETDP